MLVDGKVKDTFKHDKFLIGMIHLFGTSPEDRLERAKREIDIYIKNGFDAVLVEDYFGDLDDVINVLKYLKNKKPEIIYGVNVLHNYKVKEVPMVSYRISFLLAKIYGAKFVQLDSVSGQLSTWGKYSDDYYFGEELLYLKKDQPKLITFGGVRFKGQPFLSGRDLFQDLEVATQRADVIVTTGVGTGIETPKEKLIGFRNYLGEEIPFASGAGVSQKNCQEQLSIVNGAIIGSSCKDTLKALGEVDSNNVRIIADKIKILR